MCMNRGKKGGGGGICLSPNAIRLLGIVLIAVGVLVIVAFIPLKYWMALLGMIILAAGIALRVLF